MSFINQYIKAGNYNYTDAIQSGSYIYMVAYGLVTKTDLNGAVVWEKTYSDGNFDKILAADNGDLLILGGGLFYPSKTVTRINTNGVVLWSKTYELPDPPANSTGGRSPAKLLKLSGDNYILFIAHNYHTSSPNLNHEFNYVFKLNGTGAISLKKLVSIPSASSFERSMAIATNGSQTLLIISREAYLEFIFLDASLNVYTNQPLQISNAISTDQLYICDVNYVDNQFIFNGQIKKDDLVDRRSFIGKVSLPASGQVFSGNVAIKLLSEDSARCFFAGESGNYFLSQTDYSGGRNVVKVDASFNYQWFKCLKTHTRNIRYASGSLLFTGDDILAKVDLSLASCKTTDLPDIVPVSDVLTYGTSHVVTLSTFDSTVTPVTITTSPVTSQLYDVCSIVTPTFTQVGPICAGSALPPLPTTSLNGVQGSWSPAMNNQATTTYTFTPNNTTNATTATMTIVVNPMVTPAFTQVGPFYAGSTIPPLPTTSNNNITGQWSPAINNQATTTYTFTPNAGQCATTATMTITINALITPTFTQVGPICAGSVLQPLPTTSLNGITGSWSPAVNNMATTTYTFTPNPGQNASTATLTIVVNPVVTPAFTQVGPFYAGSTIPPLPTTSNNNITGHWSPAINNQTTTTYTFTPNAGQCATTATMTITINALIKPTFSSVGAICAGSSLSPLPTTSLNGITGSWSPALNNMATTTYTFTPNPGQNATTATLTIVVNPLIYPTFTQIGPIIIGSPLSPLPTTSLQGVPGTWAPAVNNLQTTTYTFTPNKAISPCAQTATMTIVVNPPPCVKDETICNLYSHVLSVVNGCLEDPAEISGPADYPTFAKCVDDIFSAINSFDVKYPQYEIADILAMQIKTLEIFIKNPNATTYEDAWNALQHILMLLSQSGNCNCENNFTIKDNASIQSGSLYLQAAGSIGADSTKGIHLRWVLKGALENHLPKGNYALPGINFNKDNDFIKIYRTLYVEHKVSLDLSNAPNQVHETPSAKNWVYAIENKVFYVHFKNTARYNYVKNQLTIDPYGDPQGFIKNYGNSLIEIENKTELSFAVTPQFVEVGNPSNVRVELLSVAENKISAAKGASLRNQYDVAGISGTKLLSENIRSIRFRSENAYISNIDFEFYSDLIIDANDTDAWDFLGRFSLTKEASVAFERLEPESGVIDNWLRYKEGDVINVENYRTKWNGTEVQPDSRIEEVVKKYIQLSNAADNPMALETVYTNSDDEVTACLAEGNPEYTPNTTATENGFEISNLHLLQMGSLDYHIARMLGLGHLDLDPEATKGQYIYLSDYTTYASLNDGLGARSVQHLYCSLPTSLEDERLPIPVELNRIENGIFYQPELDPEDPEPPTENASLTDANGLSLDGTTQFYSLFSDHLPEEALNASFYYKNDAFISADLTIPVYAGLKYRKDNEAPEWRRPGLAYDSVYYNADMIINETKPILIPDNGNPIYIHRERISGTYEYTSYGINWFSRASEFGISIVKTTNIQAKNTLLPPTNIVATLIQQERPLLLTTATEQEMLRLNPHNDDKTLVRLTFEYNHAQELVDYHHKIDDETVKDYSEREHELFADDILIKFRDHVPQVISGKVKQVLPGGNAVLSIIETDIFQVYSSGIDATVIPQTNPPTYNEQIIPVVPPGTAQNFIGSVLVVDEVEYVIHAIDTSSAYPKFTVFKSDISGALVNLSTNTDPANLVEPASGSLFVIVENMQKDLSWGTPNPINAFRVNIDHTQTHREPEIIVKSTDCSTNTYVQKFRGIYMPAKIEKILEKIYNSADQDGDPENDPTVKKHIGLYMVTFPGFQLNQHSQYHTDGQNSVEWYNGIARLHTWDGLGFDPGYRKNFKVVRAENIGTASDLVLYIEDLTFPKDVFNPQYPAMLAAYKGKLMRDNVLSNNQYVNYYPGYKAYIYMDADLGVLQGNVLPEGDQDVRYTIFGLRSHDKPNEFPFDNTTEFISPYSVPTFMFAQGIKEPVQPQKPSGGMYATRPDYFGKSSYTFETVYGPIPNSVPPHKPHSVQFNRASDVQFLSAIYDNSVLGYDPETRLPIRNTVQSILEDIFMDGGEDFYVNRWNNLLGFDYNYDGDPPNDPLFPDENGRFRYFEGRRLPMPDSSLFINAINNFINAHNHFYENESAPVNLLIFTVTSGSVMVTFEGNEVKFNTIIIPEVLNPDGTIRNGQLTYGDFLRDVLLNCFVPLTEIPVIYDHINTGNYKPIPKKQVVRDRNGQLLNPSDPAFDMAPMAIRLLNQANRHTTRFTDFGLDGASNAKYFYAVREINKQMKTSPYSAILGPVSLVNTAPPTAPEIIKIIPVLENRNTGVNPAVRLEINSYPEAQNIRKINIYRIDNAADALSVRTMNLVRVIDLESENLTSESKWIFTDDFSDLPEVPYGDIMYYRLTVSRIIKYNDAANQLLTDYAPSEASKLVMTNIVENYSPASPVVKYQSEPLLPAATRLDYVILNWNETVYKGNYYLYKMNAQGNWVEIARVMADRLEKGTYHIFNTDNSGSWVETATVDSVSGTIYLQLADTAFNDSGLTVLSDDGTKLYHHFKVIAENTSGMRSREENILSIYNEVTWNAIGGIAPEDRSEGMIIGNTFIIR